MVSILQSGWDGSHDQAEMLLSLDLQKAFDSVSSSYLFGTLGLRPLIYRTPHQISILYSRGQDQITRAIFWYHQNSKRNAPGIPSITADLCYTIESLAIAIRTNPNIAGVRCGPNVHKCGLFADDLILFVISPTTSLPVICKLLEDFSGISGLQVNYTKSQALNISLQPSLMAQLKDSFHFSWSESSIRYLGINLIPKFEQFYQANYSPPHLQKTRNRSQTVVSTSTLLVGQD